MFTSLINRASGDIIIEIFILIISFGQKSKQDQEGPTVHTWVTEERETETRTGNWL